jgi:hypothetical protein
MRDELLRSTKLFVGETTASVLDPGRGRTKKSYFWVLARDDRPWCGRAPPAVVYSYAPGHSGDHAAALLKGYSGVLQTDGYAVYLSLADPNRKNALFAGSDEGAENWAMLASPVETCQLHGVNPEAYLSDVLTKLVNNWPNSRLAELTP